MKYEKYEEKGAERRIKEDAENAKKEAEVEKDANGGREKEDRKGCKIFVEEDVHEGAEEDENDERDPMKELVENAEENSEKDARDAEDVEEDVI